MGIQEIRARGGRTVLLDADVIGPLDDFARSVGLLRPHGRRQGQPDRASAVRALLALRERLPPAALGPLDGPPRVYVAAASSDIERAEAAIARVRELGAQVTFDWTVPVRELGSAPADYAVARHNAEADIRAVASAECLLVADGDRSYGRTVELGAGLMRALHDSLPIVQWGACGDLSRGRLWETLVAHVRVDLDDACESAIAAAGAYRNRVRALLAGVPALAYVARE